jgi:putative ABC transport system permease protein
MRAHRFLLHLFPASFRGEYGREMAAVFARRHREASGVLARAGLWAETIADVVVNAVAVHLDLLRQDLRFAGRSLRRQPGFAITAVLVAALGIGATTAAFSLIDHVLLRPLPFRDPEQLVKVWQDQTARGYSRMELSPSNYRDWAHDTTSFSAMAPFWQTSANLIGVGDPQRLEGAAVGAELFTLLGTPAAFGRALAAGDERPEAPRAVVLSYGLWQSRFGGDPGVLGRAIVLDEQAHTVVGVMPRDFSFPTREGAFWTALRFTDDDYADRTNVYLRCIGRLKPGVSLEQARADLGVIAKRLESEYPRENEKVGATVVRLRDEVPPQTRLLLGALVAGAFCLLAIACSNLASLLVARAAFRAKELSVRSALGAGRERLVRQLLTESLILAGTGGVLGILLAVAVTPLAARLVPTVLPIAEAPSMDLRVLAFAVAITLVTGVAFGLLPAWRACAGGTLKEGAREGVGGRKERLRSVLVTAEIALSIVLLVASGLLVRALSRVKDIDPGFRTAGVLTLRTSLPMPRYEPTARRTQFYARVLADVRALPGVTAAGYTSFLPMVMRGGIWPVLGPGVPETGSEEQTASLRFVTPGYFETLGIPLRAGRDVSESDTSTAPAVAVVSQSFVDRYWPGQGALGRQFTIAFQPRLIVGVVGDVKVRGLERESEPQVYLAQPQVPDGSVIFYVPKDLAVRSSLPAESLVPTLRRIIAAADPEQPVSEVRSLAAIVEAETGARTVQASVIAAFAAAAALLAGVGIQGLVGFTVSRRLQEFAVRQALGAERRDILRLVLGEGVRLAAAGLALGLALAYVGGRGLEALLAGVSPYDPAAYALAAGLCAAMALLGTVVPAVRAMRVDPQAALRLE